MSILMPDKVNIPFRRAVLPAKADDILKMMIPDNPAHTHAHQLRNRVTGQLNGFLIPVNNVPFQIKGNNRIMIVLLQ
ncbi:hypothetical protein D3C85_1781670 [compost metagenome]